MWDEQAGPLAEHFDLVRFDVRGHGGSTTGSRVELTIDRLARDALAVLDACGVERAHLCGLSLGAMTAMRIAFAWPDRVSKLVLSNTTPYMPPRETWEARIVQVRGEGVASITEGTLQRWFTADFREREPVKVDRIRQMLLSTAPAAYVACCAAIRDMDQREDIRSIRAPVLSIGGRQDPGTPPATAELIATSIPGARLHLLDAAHLSNVERADEFTSAVSGFLAQV
jgi:3-oxoadipate enol-lactonase